MSERPVEHGDESLRRLVRLAREALAGAGDEGDLDEVGFARIREHRAVRPPSRRRIVWAVTLAIAILVGASGVVAWRAGRAGTPLTFEIVEDGGGSGAGPSDGPETRILFSDGSELAIAGGARVSVHDLRANGARIVLTRGRARAFFVPRPSARWRLNAGPYGVEVGGELTETAFDVAWSDDTQALELSQRAGSARVTGPLIGNGMALARGQHLSTRIRDNKVVLDAHARAPEP